MKTRPCLYLAFVLVAACEPVSRSSEKTPDQTVSPKPELLDYSYCGASTTKQRIKEYFDHLALYVESSDKSLLQNLIADNVIIGENGQSRSVPSSAFQAQPNLIPHEDWAEISRRGESRLVSGGWRGCFLNYGKAGFNVDENGHLRLFSFNLDMAWDGDAQPE